MLCFLPVKKIHKCCVIFKNKMKNEIKNHDKNLFKSLLKLFFKNKLKIEINKSQQTKNMYLHMKNNIVIYPLTIKNFQIDGVGL